MLNSKTSETRVRRAKEGGGARPRNTESAGAKVSPRQ